jgi:MoxR-like ATPase
VLKPGSEIVEAVNAALYLRRPLLVTGLPGSGKSTLIHSVAWQLQMGPVLVWPITSRSSLKQGIYEYDALARLQAVKPSDSGPSSTDSSDLGRFVTLNPLGAALHQHSWPRPLLIDEIDKSDLDLPNDLLNVLEEGRYIIPELARAGGRFTVRAPGLDLDGKGEAVIEDGLVAVHEFPFIVMTSNGEREFPAPFLRRCIRLDMPKLEAKDLAAIVEAHLGHERAELASRLIDEVLKNRERLTIDQLLNAVFLTIGGQDGRVPDEATRKVLEPLILKPL